MPLTFHFQENAEYPELLLDSVEIHSLEEAGSSYLATGKIDTGATWSAIPRKAVKKLELQPSRIIDAYDYDNELRKQTSYWVRPEMRGLTNKLVEVISRNKSDVLIGRDILTDLKLISSPSEKMLSLEKPKLPRQNPRN